MIPGSAANFWGFCHPRPLNCASFAAQSGRAPDLRQNVARVGAKRVDALLQQLLERHALVVQVLDHLLLPLQARAAGYG